MYAAASASPCPRFPLEAASVSLESCSIPSSERCLKKSKTMDNSVFVLAFAFAFTFVVLCRGAKASTFVEGSAARTIANTTVRRIVVSELFCILVDAILILIVILILNRSLYYIIL